MVLQGVSDIAHIRWQWRDLGEMLFAPVRLSTAVQFELADVERLRQMMPCTGGGYAPLKHSRIPDTTMCSSARILQRP